MKEGETCCSSSNSVHLPHTLRSRSSSRNPTPGTQQTPSSTWLGFLFNIQVVEDWLEVSENVVVPKYQWLGQTSKRGFQVVTSPLGPF